jgi:predicted RNA binding protein YcfA (HicA-like mRNA interferase family)
VVFPSLKARQFLALLRRKPLRYRVVAQQGSHRKLESDSGYPPIGLSYHDKDTVPPGVVRKYLLEYIGLSEEEAKRLL